MNKQRALDVLRIHNCCEKHGCKKLETKGHPYQNWNATISFYCPECAAEELAKIEAEIAEAKKVLGL
jgi:hypothetical protein